MRDREIALSTTQYAKFTTVNGSGLPTTLGNTPSLVYYVNGGTTSFTSGLSLTADFNSTTGLNHVAVTVTTSCTGLVSGAQVAVLVAAGTVSGVSMVGYPVFEYAIGPSSWPSTQLGAAGSGLTAIPAVAQATAVSALATAVTSLSTNLSALTIYVGVSGSGLGAIPGVAQASAVAAVATSVSALATAVTSLSTGLSALVGYVGVSGSGLGNVPGLTTGVAALATAVSALAANVGVSGSGLGAIPWTAAYTSGAAAAVWDAQTADYADVGSMGAALAAAGAGGDPWSTALPGAYGAGTAGNIIGTYVTGTYTRLGAAGSALSAIPNVAQASAVSALATAVTSLSTNLSALTIYVGVSGSGLGAIPGLDATKVSAIATAVSALSSWVGVSGSGLGAVPGVAQAAAVSSLSENIGVSGSALGGMWKMDMSAMSGEAARSPLNALRFLRNKWTTVAGTLTVTKEDDATTAWTSTLTEDATAAPIIGSDPT